MPAREFAGVIGHAPVLDVLSRAAETPAPGYLFVGPQGVGKHLVAERLARVMLVHPLNRPLDAHPDFVRLTREEGAKEIVVKQARAVLERIHLTSAMGGRTVVLVEDAERLNEEAANALLKGVEEPPPGVTFLFIAEQASRLPDTLRSRLVTVHLERVPRADLVQALRASGVAREAAERAAERSRGCPGLAKRLLEDPAAWETQEAEASALLAALQSAPLGVQLASIERTAQRAEAEEDAEQAWREMLAMLMRASGPLLAADPVTAARLGHGFIHGWRLAGSSLSPRLGLEWALVQPSVPSNVSVPTFLLQPYL